MFMFRSRKTHLTKQLLKVRKRLTPRRPLQNETGRPLEDDLITHQSESVETLLKRLQDNQLDMLLKAVHGLGRDRCNCVLLPREYDSEPHMVCCRAWRWPDLRQSNELKQLPMCRSATDPIYICCNPYHWSRLCQPESPPPPYSRHNNHRIRTEERAPCAVPIGYRDLYTPSSLTTNGDSNMNQIHCWCKLAYWELAERVGPLYCVEQSAVNVFGNIPFGDGLCLETLTQQRTSPMESVKKTRCKIGLGITLSQEECGRVWLYNLSEHPVFVNSPSLILDDYTSDYSSPIRVPAEHCLCIFDPSRTNNFTNYLPANIGPVDTNSIRVSFVKGWGAPNYKRREITSCECWLEILLAPCR